MSPAAATPPTASTVVVGNDVGATVPLDAGDAGTPLGAGTGAGAEGIVPGETVTPPPPQVPIAASGGVGRTSDSVTAGELGHPGG